MLTKSLHFMVWLQGSLEHAKLSIKKLQKLFGVIPHIRKKHRKNKGDEDNKSSTDEGEKDDEGGTGTASNDTTVNADAATNSAVISKKRSSRIPRSKYKNVKPWYQHIKKDDIPIIKESNNVSIKVLVGEIKDVKSSVQTYSPVSILDVNFFESNQISLDISKNQIAMVYVINGELQFIESNTIASKGQMVYFDQSSTEINLHSISSSGSYLLLAGEPLKESIIRHGPFVTNTDEEMQKAMLDYQNGKMGILK